MCGFLSEPVCMQVPIEATEGKGSPEAGVPVGAGNGTASRVHAVDHSASL